MTTLYPYEIGHVRFSLREKRDISWLSQLGELTDVFAQNDSGNLSLGAVKDGVKRFYKIAGLATAEYLGRPEQAVENLERALAVYRDIQHQSLVGMEKAFCRDGLLCGVSPWVAGDCLFAHWTFDSCDRYEDPRSPWYRFTRLSLGQRLAAVDTVLDFMCHVERCGYVAADLYDGSLLYDFSAHVLWICDIDFFTKSPAVNWIGEDYWGSRRFKAPEEYVLGAALDSVTNVYTLGRLGLALLGDGRSPDRQSFVGGDGLWGVLLKATTAERSGRYPSVAALTEAVRAASGSDL